MHVLIGLCLVHLGYVDIGIGISYAGQDGVCGRWYPVIVHLVYSIVCSLRILSIYLPRSGGDLFKNTSLFIGSAYAHTTLAITFLAPSSKGLFVVLKAESPPKVSPFV